MNNNDDNNNNNLPNNFFILAKLILMKYIYCIYIQVHLNKLECREKVIFSSKLFQKVKLSYILDSLHVK